MVNTQRTIWTSPNVHLSLDPRVVGRPTHCYTDIIEKEYKNVFDFIIILCPTIWINKTYTEWKYLVGDTDVVGLEISPDKLDVVLGFIIKMYGGSRTAVVIDDMSNANEQHKNNNQLTYLAYSGRHHNISLFVLSQKLNSISTGIRDNATRVIFFKTHNKNSVKILRDEFLACVRDAAEEKNLLGELSTQRYLDINLNNNPPSYFVR